MNISTLYDLAIPLLDLYPAEMHTHAQQKPCMSIEELFVIALNWKHPLKSIKNKVKLEIVVKTI